MEKKIRNVILADCEPEEIKDFCNGIIRGSENDKWRVISSVSNWGRNSLWADIKRYFIYFKLPFSIFFHRKEYDNIIGWQQFYALIFVYFCELFHVDKSTKVFAVNYTYKEKNGIVGKVYHRFMKRIANSKYLDKLFVPSYEYVETLYQQLGVDKEKVIVLPFGVPDTYGKYKPTQKYSKYALAIGRSNRDYDWLINEWQDIDYKLLIISDSYVPKVETSSKIEILDNISGEDQFPYIMGCDFMVLPIKDSRICSGDTVLLTSMSYEKTVFVTEPSTLAEMYINHEKDGIIVSKQNGDLKQKLDKNMERMNFIGESARRTYLENFSREKMGIIVGQELV